MSTALVSAIYDFGDVLSKNNPFSGHKTHMKVSERKSVPNFSLRRTSSPNAAVAAACLSNNKVTSAAVIASLAEASAYVNSMGQHRKLDRSLSEPVDRSGQQQQQQQRAAQANSSRYKTELCRPFEESGKCKYGDKCQFAHGAHELRTLARHPKYKTELCRTFHTIGFCPYGPRCHFIHNAEISVDGMYRPKALSLSSFNGDGDSPTPSSLSESPTSIGGFFDDYFPTPATTPTANNAFTFNSQDFSVLVSSPPQSTSSSPPTPSKRVQQQNAYNTALNQYTVSVFNNQINNINDMDSCVFRESTPIVGVPTPTPTPPLMEPNPPSPVESVTSELDNLSVCGSPPTDLNGIRLPIFSRLSTSED